MNPVSMLSSLFFFFFNDTATTEIYTLSLHDALPISARSGRSGSRSPWPPGKGRPARRRSRSVRSPPSGDFPQMRARSEEHTSELQSPCNLVCRLLLEKKKKLHFTPHDSGVRHRLSIV